MGDKQANLKQAIDKLRARGIHILKESSVLATEPWGGGSRIALPIKWLRWKPGYQHKTC